MLYEKIKKQYELGNISDAVAQEVKDANDKGASDAQLYEIVKKYYASGSDVSDQGAQDIKDEFDMANNPDGMQLIDDEGNPLSLEQNKDALRKIQELEKLQSQGMTDRQAGNFQAIFPRVSTSLANEGVPDLLSMGTAKNMLLGGLDASSRIGQIARSSLNALGGGDFKQSMSDINPTSTNPVIAMGESIMMNPLTPFGGGLTTMGKSLGGRLAGSSAPAQFIGKNLGVGGITTGAEDAQRRLSGQEGVTPIEGALGMAIPFAGAGVSKMLSPKAPNAQILSGQNPNATLTESMTENLIGTAKRTGLDLDQVSVVPDYARGVMTTLNDSERQVFKEMQDKALAYHRRDDGSIRPLEIEANKWLPDIATKFNDYRQKVGKEMGDIEDRGLQGGADTYNILTNISNAFKEDGLDLVRNSKTGKIEIAKSADSKINPDKFPELKEVVDEFFNELPENATGKQLRATQMRALSSANQAVGLGKSNKADRILKILDNSIDEELERQMNEVSPELGARYSMLKTKYGEVKDIQEFLGDRTGTEIKWTKEDTGEVEKGTQTGASFFQALTNSGSNQRGATLLLNLAQKEFGLPNLQKRAIMARYAEEGAGIRGAKQVEDPKNKVAELWDKGRSLVSEKYRAEKLLPQQAKISEKLSDKNPQKKPSKLLTGASKAVEKTTPFGSLIGANVQKSQEDAKKNKSKLQGKN